MITQGHGDAHAREHAVDDLKTPYSTAMRVAHGKSNILVIGRSRSYCRYP
jgi:hypothetical protein